MTYDEYRKERQEQFNSLPIFFAFSQKQFEAALEKMGNPNKEDLISIGAGGFIHKDTKPALDEFIKSDNLEELMKDYEFAKGAFYSEMANREYVLTLDDFEVCECFGDIEYDGSNSLEHYAEQLNWEPQTIQAYKDARKKYLSVAYDWC